MYSNKNLMNSRFLRSIYESEPGKKIVPAIYNTALELG